MTNDVAMFHEHLLNKGLLTLVLKTVNVVYLDCLLMLELKAETVGESGIVTVNY
jgi:hypothetical protein